MCLSVVSACGCGNYLLVFQCCLQNTLKCHRHTRSSTEQIYLWMAYIMQCEETSQHLCPNRTLIEHRQWAKNYSLSLILYVRYGKEQIAFDRRSEYKRLPARLARCTSTAIADIPHSHWSSLWDTVYWMRNAKFAVPIVSNFAGAAGAAGAVTLGLGSRGKCAIVSSSCCHYPHIIHIDQEQYHLHVANIQKMPRHPQWSCMTAWAFSHELNHSICSHVKCASCQFNMANINYVRPAPVSAHLFYWVSKWIANNTET